MGVSAAGHSQHVQRQESLQELEKTQAEDKIASGLLGGAPSVSYYQAGVLPAGADGRVVPIASPVPGSEALLGNMNMADLQALLQGLKNERDDTVSETSEQVTLANREKTRSAREKNITELQSQLDPAGQDSKDKCATAKIVMGAILGPVGLPLLIMGALDKKEVVERSQASNQMMAAHYGDGLPMIEEFEKEYASDSVDSKMSGRTIDRNKHLSNLNEMQSLGVIDGELHRDVSMMVANGESPESIQSVLLHDAVTAYENGQLPPLDKVDNLAGNIQNLELEEGDIDSQIQGLESEIAQAKAMRDSDGDFNKFLLQLAQMMEKDEEGLSKVQENIQNAQQAVFLGAQNQQWQKGQMTPHI